MRQVREQAEAGARRRLALFDDLEQKRCWVVLMLQAEADPEWMMLPKDLGYAFDEIDRLRKHNRALAEKVVELIREVHQARAAQ